MDYKLFGYSLTCIVTKKVLVHFRKISISNIECPVSGIQYHINPVIRSEKIFHN